MNHNNSNNQFYDCYEPFLVFFFIRKLIGLVNLNLQTAWKTPSERSPFLLQKMWPFHREMNWNLMKEIETGCNIPLPISSVVMTIGVM